MSKLPDFISIIVPGYNEEKRIAESLQTLSAFCEKHFEKYEILFVNDGSNDGTGDIVRNLAVPYLKTIHLEFNQGKGFAVKTGMLQARGDYRFFTDADLPYGLSAIPDALGIFHAIQYDAIAGARDLPESSDQSRRTLLRRTASKSFSALVRRVLKIDFHDTQCGFKGFTAEAAEALFSLSKIRGYAFDVELFLLVQTHNLKMGKVPVRLIEKHRSKVRLGLDAPMMVWDVVKLYRRYKGSTLP